MPIWREICRAERKCMPFFGTVTERNIYKWCNARLGYRDLDFFQDSRIRVKRRLKWTDRSKVDGPSTTSSKTSMLWAKSEIKIYSKVDTTNFRWPFVLSFLTAQFHKWTSTFELNSYLVLRLADQCAAKAKIWNLIKVILVGNKENISWKWKMR